MWLFINHRFVEQLWSRFYLTFFFSRLFLSAIDPEQVHPDKGIPPSGVLARLELDKKLDSFQKLRRKNQDWRKITGASSEDRSIPVVTYEGIPLRKKRKMGGSCRSPRPSPSDGPGSNTDQT